MPNNYYSINVSSHISDSNYIWKYETQANKKINSDHIFYINKEYLELFKTCIPKETIFSKFICKFSHPLETFNATIIKTVGLFVHHNISTFIYTPDNKLTAISLYGFVMLFMLLVTFNNIINKSNIFTIEGLVFMFIALNIFMFSTITYPETRFINHIMQLIPINYMISKSGFSEKKYTEITIFVCSSIIYLLAYTYFKSIQVFTY